MAALSSIFSRPRRLGVRILTGNLSSDFRSIQDAMASPGVWKLALSSGGGGGGEAYSAGTHQYYGEGGSSGDIASFRIGSTVQLTEVASVRYMEVVDDGKGGLRGTRGASIGVRYGQRSEVTSSKFGGTPGRHADPGGGYDHSPWGSEKTVYWSITSGGGSRRWQTITAHSGTGLQKHPDASYMSGGGYGGVPDALGGDSPQAGKDGGILFLVLLG